MYKAHTFLASDTWSKRGPSDERQFFRVLKTVVRNPEFDPETMGGYMRQKVLPTNKHGQDTELLIDYYQRAIADYVAAAWAVTCSP